MFKKMDTKLKAYLDDLVAKTIEGEPSQAWTDQRVKEIKSTLAIIADSDALETALGLSKVFDEAKKRVVEMALDEDVADDVFYELSVVRKQLGIDPILRGR